MWQNHWRLTGGVRKSSSGLVFFFKSYFRNIIVQHGGLKKSDYRGFVSYNQKSEFINNMVSVKRTPLFYLSLKHKVIYVDNPVKFNKICDVDIGIKDFFLFSS